MNILRIPLTTFVKHKHININRQRVSFGISDVGSDAAIIQANGQSAHLLFHLLDSQMR